MLSLALLTTIIFTLALGILTGYAAVTALLHSFGHRPSAPRAAAPLAASSGVAGGD